MISKALRKIEAGLLEELANPDGINPDAIKIAATRIGAQAEMLEAEL